MRIDSEANSEYETTLFATIIAEYKEIVEIPLNYRADLNTEHKKRQGPLQTTTDLRSHLLLEFSQSFHPRTYQCALKFHPHNRIFRLTSYVFSLYVALESAPIVIIGDIQNFITSYSYCLTPSAKAPPPRPLRHTRFYDPIIQSISSFCSWLPCSFFSAFLAWKCPQPQRRRCFGTSTLPL